MTTLAERQQGEIMRRLGLMTVANGYLTDIGYSVHVERMEFDENDLMPLINVMMSAEESTETTGKRINIARTFRIEVWRNSDLVSLIAHLQQVKRAVMRNDARWSDSFADSTGQLGLLAYTGSESMQQESAGKTISGVTALFRVTCAEKVGDPSSTG